MSDYICPHNCAYRTNAGHCGMTGGYESCQYIKYLEKLEKEKTNIKPFAGKRTNADRIRAMTDEELAGILAMQGVVSPPWCAENYDCPYADQDPVRCDLCALKWLKQEAGQDARDGP